MCRLFGLHAGSTPVRATFWLLDAPDSLAEQSRRNPDGTGVGVFGPGGRAVVDKQPMAAWEDDAFAREAKELEGTTFLAHVRYASTGADTVDNTHPFLQDGVLLAHNGAVEGLDRLEARARELGTLGLVRGQTDSERVFAVITGEVRRHDGDVDAGLAAAVRWVADTVPLLALNLLLATSTHLWALRYPDTHDLFLLDRRHPGPPTAVRSDRIRAELREPAGRPSVIVASERMDGEDGWEQLEPGVLVRIDPDLTIHRTPLLTGPPAYPLSVADLQGGAARSQQEP